MSGRILLGAVLALSLGVLFGCGAKNGGDQQPASGAQQEAPGHATDHLKNGAKTVDLKALGILNAKCPITGEEVDPKVTLPYKGKKVGFCCDDCIEKWQALSADEKAAKLQQ